uniref:Uncharacterized protein n=1 Tax=Dulem virus 31 TaxID=3145749 RepID=A0AAU8ATT9_9VIRU
MSTSKACNSLHAVNKKNKYKKDLPKESPKE